MAKYIDADRLKTEIEKTYKSEIQPWLSGVSPKSVVYEYILPLIDSLQQENLIPNDLEEASSKFATHTAPNGVSIEFLEEKLSFQEGAKWDREQIMKNAKDGWLDEECVIVLNDGTRVDLQPDYEKNPAFEFEYAQDVRVIVLPKED